MCRALGAPMRVRTLPIALSAVALGSIFASIGCGHAAPVGTANLELQAALVPVRDCAEAEQVIRDLALREMNRRIDAMILAVDTATASNGCYGSADAGASAAGGSSSGGSPSPAPEERAGSASSTNNQVAGVDEADFIKNDTKYIYTVANGALHVIDAFPAATAHELARVPLEGTPKKLFVEGDRAFVYSSVASTTGGVASPSSGRGGGECTYGYDCTPQGDGTSTKITVLDLSNKSAPQLVREVRLSGSYIAARRIGDAVHTVVSTPQVSFPSLSYYLTSTSRGCGMPIDANERALRKAEYEALRAKNAQIIASTPITRAFPSVKDSLNAGDPGATCGGFYRSSLGDGAAFTSVVSLGVVNPAPAKLATVMSRPGHVYASADALYLAVPHTRADYGWYAGFAGDKVVSDIHKFRIGTDPTATAYQASGLVKGGVLNQFAMDESSGYFRVATSSGHTPDPNVDSAVAVLQQQGPNLVTVGKVDGIAKTEDIRAVRFDGNRGYVVTFKKTDPLFVIALDNPTAPAVLGELKIPGFSTYMHMMDATHLLTIGYDADDQGSFAFFSGILLQIFDVSNPTAPALVHKERIGTRGSSSAALTNHLAFNYFQPKNLLALPMTVCEGGGSGSFGQNMTFSGLMVYDVTAQNGFALRGKISHPNAPVSTNGGYDSGLCNHWWTDATSVVQRSVIMDDFVYSVAPDVIRVANVNSLAAPVSAISLK